MRSAVFLDRDGVLIAGELHDGVPTPSSVVRVLPGVRRACAELRAQGHLLVMVTNQPDIARGIVDRATVDAVNHHLAEELGLDDVNVCPHDDADGCACRKPRPGLVLQAAVRLGIDLGASVLVGDRWRDAGAAAAAGLPFVHVDHGYPERQPASVDVVVSGLLQALPHIDRLVLGQPIPHPTEVLLA